jgi:hypothetical protein
MNNIMNSPDWRSLCAELLETIDMLLEGDRRPESERGAYIRALLAQPEPVAPTEGELQVFYDEHFISWSKWRRNQETCTFEIYLLRAVLARWGAPAAQPVPVSERLPGPEDCDAEGCCWAIGERGNWMCVHVIGRSWSNPIYTHWLPHWALPVPK